MKSELLLTGVFLLVMSANAQGVSTTDSTGVDKEAVLRGVDVTGYRKIEHGDAVKSVFTLNKKLPKNTKIEKALQELPGITRTEKGFVFAGNERISRLLIDGMEATLEEVVKLNVSEVEKVEVKHLTLEGNDYDGEINIVRKKVSIRALNGELGGTVGTLRSNNGLSSRLSYQDRRFEAVLNADVVSHRYDRLFDMQRTFHTGTQETYSSDGTGTVWQKFGSFRSTYVPSQALSMMFSHIYMGHSVSTNDHTRNIDGSNSEINRDEGITNHMTNVVVRYSQNAHNRLSLKGRLHHYKNTNDLNSMDLQTYKVKMNEYSAEAVQEMDSLRLLRSWHSLAVGGKFVLRDKDLSADDELRGSIYAAYVTDFFRLSDRVSLNWQLKSEWAGYDLLSSSYHEFSLLPSMSVNYTLPKGSLLLTGERVVLRPSVDYLSPKVFYVNEVVKEYGNPDLKAEYTDKYKIRYNQQIRNMQVGLTVSYSYVSRLIAPVYKSDYDVKTYENAGYGNITSFGVSLMKPFLDYRLTFNANAHTTYYDYRLSSANRSSALASGNAGWGWGASMNVVYVSTKEWMFNANVNVVGKRRELSSTDSQRPALNLSVEKSFFKDRLTLSVSGMQLLGTKTWQTIDFVSAREKTNVDISMTNVLLSLRWTFGKHFASRAVGSVIENDDISTKQ